MRPDDDWYDGYDDRRAHCPRLIMRLFGLSDALLIASVCIGMHGVALCNVMSEAGHKGQ